MQIRQLEEGERKEVLKWKRGIGVANWVRREGGEVEGDGKKTRKTRSKLSPEPQILPPLIFSIPASASPPTKPPSEKKQY